MEKKEEQEKKDKETKKMIVRGIEKYMLEGIGVVVTLPNKRLKEMIHYFLNQPTSGIVQMKKELMMAATRKYTEEGINYHSSNQQEQNQIFLGSDFFGNHK